MATTKMCPIMSCRVTSVSDPNKPMATMTPTVITCQEEQCAWYDCGNKLCGVLSGLINRGD